MSGFEQDLIVESFPQGVVIQSHRELTQTRDQVFEHPLLVDLGTTQRVFQLQIHTNTLTVSFMCADKHSDRPEKSL